MGDQVTRAEELPSALQDRALEEHSASLGSVQSQEAHVPFFEISVFLQFSERANLNPELLARPGMQSRPAGDQSCLRVAAVVAAGREREGEEVGTSFVDIGLGDHHSFSGDF